MSNQTITYYNVKLERSEVVREIFTHESYTTPEQVHSLFAYMENLDREQTVVAMFDAQMRQIGMHTAGIGTIDQSLGGGKEIARVLILAEAHSWAFAHNHPSGDPRPSTADIILTERLAAIGQLFSIPLRDHIVIGERGAFYSFAQSDPIRLHPNLSVGTGVNKRRTRTRRA